MDRLAKLRGREKEILKSKDLSDLVEVAFEPGCLHFNAERGRPLIEIAAANGIVIRSECGARGICGKCKVRVTPREGISAPTNRELRALGPEAKAEGIRLACQAKVTASVTVEVPVESFDSSESWGKIKVDSAESVQPAVRRIVTEFPGATEAENRRPKDLLTMIEHAVAVGMDHAGAKSAPGLAVLRQLGRMSDPEEPITVSHHHRLGLVAVRGGAKKRSLGFAIDIGTTTIAAHLCDLTTGRVLTSAASSNPQRTLGEDVIARISYCQDHAEGTEILHRLACQEVGALGDACLKRVSAPPDDVDDVTVVGNSTMMELFLGINPQALGRHPYLPVSRSSVDCRAEELGLEAMGDATVHVLPVVSGFIGGDTIGAVLSQSPHKHEEFTLIVDIGTNGELVLGHKDLLLATSCATGPAFEGGHLSCGMRATSGAIHRVNIDRNTKNVSYQVIGSHGAVAPLGLCGSGVIDAIAEMLRTGIVLPSGRLQEGATRVVSDERGVGREFVLVPGDYSASGSSVSLTLSDVRHVQLAKAAVQTGIRFLLREAGVTRIDKMVLTGTFGANFSWESAQYIGLLPSDEVVNRIEVVENAAGHGAILSLVDVAYREEAERLSRTIRVLELAKQAGFNEEFVSATRLGKW